MWYLSNLPVAGLGPHSLRWRWPNFERWVDAGFFLHWAWRGSLERGKGCVLFPLLSQINSITQLLHNYRLKTYVTSVNFPIESQMATFLSSASPTFLLDQIGSLQPYSFLLHITVILVFTLQSKSISSCLWWLEAYSFVCLLFFLPFDSFV